MKRVRLLDSAWLLLEAPETPMHIGILLRFSPPPGAAAGYVHQVAASLRSSTSVVTPWDLILPVQKLRGLIPIWLHECYLNMDYHVQLHRLPSHGCERNLINRVAELHSQPLDPTRPLWECHVFEGLPNDHFALYVKVHHAVLDGVGGTRLMQKMLAHSPEHREDPPWVSQVGPRVRSRALPRLALPVNTGRESEQEAREKPRVLSHLARAAKELTKAALNRDDPLVTPYRGPASPLNGRITAHRSFATQACDLARLKHLARLSGGSTNDVVLAVCAGAIQRLLSEQKALPERPLTAAVPVSTRTRHEELTGTALSFCLANLGTDIEDPRQRLIAIQASTQRAKEYLGSLPRQALMPYTTIMMAPFIFEQLSRAGGRYRPMFNLVVSNVPGPKTPLYLEGARLEAVYPLSVLFHGQALNITYVRYVDSINLGFTGCPDALPGIHRLPRYTRQALAELETELSFPHRRAHLVRTRRSRPVERRAAAAAAS